MPERPSLIENVGLVVAWCVVLVAVSLLWAVAIVCDGLRAVFGTKV